MGEAIVLAVASVALAMILSGLAAATWRPGRSYDIRIWRHGVVWGNAPESPMGGRECR